MEIQGLGCGVGVVKSGDNIRAAIHALYERDLIDHATWCNALRYLDGDYRNHNLCRTAFMRCMKLETENA